MVDAAQREGSPPTVSGFPEIVSYQYRCRMCRLAKEQSGLARLIHDRRRDEGEGDRALASWAAKLLEKHGVPAVDKRGLARHFSQHVDFSEINDAVTSAFSMPEPSELAEAMDSDESALFELAHTDAALGKNESDYHQMYDMFRRLYRRIKAIDGDPTAFIGSDGGPNGYKLVMWVKLISEAGNLLAKLNRMRNDDRLVLDILEGHTKRFSLLLAESLKPELAQYIDLLRQEDTNPREVAEALDAFMRRRIVMLFRHAAIDSLQQSREEFNLH